MSDKIEKLLEENNKLLKSIFLFLISKEDSTDNKIKLLCNLGLKSEEIGDLIGMTGRGVRKNKCYKEKNDKTKAG